MDTVDWAHFEKSRSELGPGFIRILSYFREDGVKSVAAIEQAMREIGELGMFGGQFWLTVHVVNELQVRRTCFEISRQNRAQRGMGNDKPSPVHIKLESRRPLLLR